MQQRCIPSLSKRWTPLRQRWADPLRGRITASVAEGFCVAEGDELV